MTWLTSRREPNVQAIRHIAQEESVVAVVNGGVCGAEGRLEQGRKRRARTHPSHTRTPCVCLYRDRRILLAYAGSELGDVRAYWDWYEASRSAIAHRERWKSA